MMQFQDLQELTGFWWRVPGPGDAEFAAQWLQSALKADRLLQKEFSEHPDFRPTIERVEIARFVEFAPAALAFIAMWLKDVSTFQTGRPRFGIG